MSITRLLNSIRLQAQRAAAENIVNRVGVVTNYDPNVYAAVVTIQPENSVSGWLPIGAHWVGSGWGMFCPPSIGDLVSVGFVDGDVDSGFIIGRFFNTDGDVPLAVNAGEFWLVHKNGQFVKLTNDGKLAVSDGHGATVTLNGDGTISSAGTWTHTGGVNITGNVAITGNETVSGTVTGTTDVVGGGKSLKAHTHSGVTTGGGTSGPPV